MPINGFICKVGGRLKETMAGTSKTKGLFQLEVNVNVEFCILVNVTILFTI